MRRVRTSGELTPLESDAIQRRLVREIESVGDTQEQTVTPLRPTFDLERYDRELRWPFPAQPQRAMESALWQREHALAGTPVSARVQCPLPAYGELT